MMMMMTTKYKITIMTGDVTLAGNKEHGAGGLEEEQADAAGFQIQTQTPQHTPRSAKAQRSPVAGFLQLGSADWHCWQQSSLLHGLAEWRPALQLAAGVLLRCGHGK